MKDRPEELVIPSNTNNPDLIGHEKENSLDYFVNMEVMLPSMREDGLRDLYCVCGFACNDRMETSGDFHDSPLLNTQIFDIEHSNGNVQ